MFNRVNFLCVAYTRHQLVKMCLFFPRKSEFVNCFIKMYTLLLFVEDYKLVVLTLPEIV